MSLSEQETGLPEGDLRSVGATDASCSACSSDKLVPDRVKTAFWEGECLIVVEDIPALVCTTCGEQYLDDETALQLDLMKGGGFPKEKVVREMTVPVFAYGREDA